MSTRVDYILIDGREWVPDPEKRYHTVESREALITMIPRLIRNIMTDIPQGFAFPDEGIQRKDNPTMIASAQLRRLRDLELLEQQGKGSATYYLPTQKMLFPEQTLDVKLLRDGVSPHASLLPEDLKEILKKVGKRASPSTIKQLCSFRAFKPSEIALLLQRNQRYMRDHYLTPMVDSGDLELGFPDNPAHFQQSYQTKNLGYF